MITPRNGPSILMKSGDNTMNASRMSFSQEKSNGGQVQDTLKAVSQTVQSTVGGNTAELIRRREEIEAREAR